MGASESTPTTSATAAGAASEKKKEIPPFSIAISPDLQEDWATRGKSAPKEGSSNGDHSSSSSSSSSTSTDEHKYRAAYDRGVADMRHAGERALHDQQRWWQAREAARDRQRLADNDTERTKAATNTSSSSSSSSESEADQQSRVSTLAEQLAAKRYRPLKHAAGVCVNERALVMHCYHAYAINKSSSLPSSAAAATAGATAMGGGNVLQCLDLVTAFARCTDDVRTATFVTNTTSKHTNSSNDNNVAAAAGDNKRSS